MRALARRSRIALALGLGLALVLSSGCSSGSQAAAGTSRSAGSSSPASGVSVTATAPHGLASPIPTASSVESALPAASGTDVPTCIDVPYKRIVASDGTGLEVVELGTGPHGVLMLPQHDDSACTWYQDEEATDLVHAGYHVLLLEYRCTPLTDCPKDEDAQTQLPLDAAAGVAALHRAGATKVVIVGASAGGTLAVVAGAAAGPLVNGVVDLSGPADVSALYYAQAGRLNSLDAAPHLGVPSLFVVSEEDDSTSVDEVTQVYNAVPNKSKRLLVLPAEGGHGWDTWNYTGPEGAVEAIIVAFLKAND